MQCAVCSGLLAEVYASSIPFSVDSQNDICNHSITLYQCESCYHLQKNPDNEVLKELYENYCTNVVLPNEEPVKFNAEGMNTRSFRILEDILEYLPKNLKKVLDIGSGMGGMLKSFNAFFKAELYAYDISRHNEDLFHKIPNFMQFFTDLQDISGQFDCITMIHSLEHIKNPKAFLETVYPLLKDNGVFILQVPCVAENLWDIFVYDHCQHFTYNTLYSLLCNAGFDVVFPQKQMERQITVIAKKPLKRPTANPYSPFVFSAKYMQDLLEKIKILADSGRKIAVFGTTIPSVFVGKMLGKCLWGFLEEDTRKIGLRCLDKGIYAVGSYPSAGGGADYYTLFTRQLFGLKANATVGQRVYASLFSIGRIND